MEHTKEIESIVKSTLVVENKKGIPFFTEKMERYIEERIKSAVEEQKEETRQWLIDENFEGLAERLY